MTLRDESALANERKLCLLLWWRNSIALLYIGSGIAMAGQTMARLFS